MLRKVDEQFFQNYLEIVSQPPPVEANSEERLFELLCAYAELQFRAFGGCHCSLCRTHVRHVLTVLAEHKNGDHQEYDCLCTRCFESERAQSHTIHVIAGNTRLTFLSGQKKWVASYTTTAMPARSAG